MKSSRKKHILNKITVLRKKYVEKFFFFLQIRLNSDIFLKIIPNQTIFRHILKNHSIYTQDRKYTIFLHTSIKQCGTIMTLKV